ncbi:MAG: MFS transporter, partial [Steroidobacterales bacterium]
MNPLRATWPLLLGMGILMLGAGLQSTLLGVRATIEAFPTIVIGIIMSCYYVGYLIGTRLAPQFLR